MKSRDAGEPSRSWTMMGRSLTVSESAVDMRSSSTRGRNSASKSVRQSRMIWVSSLRHCAKMRLMSVPGDRDLALLPRLFHDTDEHVFHGEAPFAYLDDADASRLQLLPRAPLPARRIVFGDDGEPVAKQRDAPWFRIVLEEIERRLRLVHDHLQQVTGLPALDVGRAPLGDQLAGGHEAEAIA